MTDENRKSFSDQSDAHMTSVQPRDLERTIALICVRSIDLSTYQATIVCSACRSQSSRDAIDGQNG